MKTNSDTKIKITSDFLLKEYHGTKEMFLFSVFFVAGIFCFLSPLLIKTNDPKNVLYGMLFSLFITIPFCGFSLKKIIDIFKKRNLIKNSDYSIVEDTVTEKQMLHNGASDDTSDSYCQLDFEKHSERTGKSVVVGRKVYDETKKGDLFYLIYLNDRKNSLIGFYPAEKYELSN